MATKLLLLSLLLMAGSVSAQNQQQAPGAVGNTINGHVFDTSRRPISNIQVELQDDVGYVIARQRTNNAGRYVFNGLSAGNYSVRVITAGTNFVSQSARIQIIDISIRGRGRYSEEYTFTLKTEAEEKSGPGLKKPGAIFAQNIPDSARKAYDEAVAKLDGDNDVSGGIERLKKALDLFPEYYLALERLGSEYTKQKLYGEAAVVLKKAVGINPRGHASFYALGIAQYNLQQVEGAVESLRRAVALAPDSINAQVWLGIVLVRNAKYADAEEPLKRAYALGGTQIPDLHMYLAQVYSNTKRYKEAADELELFLKLAPGAADAERIKGLIKSLREKAKQISG